MFNTIDKVNKSILNNLKELKNIKGFEGCYFFEDFKCDQFVFFLPLTPLTTKIVYLNKGFTFNDILELYKDMLEETDLSHIFNSLPNSSNYPSSYYS